MKTWICKVCGYTHQGEEPPVNCPKCGASKDEFYTVNKRRGGCMKWFVGCILTLIAFVVICTFTCTPKPKVDDTAVASLDIYKYLGKWYEIARLDHRFERSMHQCFATYSLEKDGTIKVINQGIKKGKWKKSVGKAKLTDEPGVLRVSFCGPFYSDYRILMLAPDYSYALVGGDNGDYLWLLSRTPYLYEEKIDDLVKEAAKRGYDTDDLIWVKQSAK